MKNRKFTRIEKLLVDLTKLPIRDLEGLLIVISSALISLCIILSIMLVN